MCCQQFAIIPGFSPTTRIRPSDDAIAVIWSSWNWSYPLSLIAREIPEWCRFLLWFWVVAELVIFISVGGVPHGLSPTRQLSRVLRLLFRCITTVALVSIAKCRRLDIWFQVARLVIGQHMIVALGLLGPWHTVVYSGKGIVSAVLWTTKSWWCLRWSYAVAKALKACAMVSGAVSYPRQQMSFWRVSGMLIPYRPPSLDSP